MSRVSYEITDDNFYECIEVSKQILWMYHDIVLNGGIVHNIDFEKVNYEKYIMCEIVEDRLKNGFEEKVVKLVNQGCFTALCCYVSNLMDEELRDMEVIKLIDNILMDERINDFKFEKDLLIFMKSALNQKPSYQLDVDKYWTEFPDGNAFYKKLPEAYTNYVLAYYQSMLEGINN